MKAVDKLFNIFDQYPAIPIGMLVFVVVMCILSRRRQNASACARRRNAARKPVLDAPLFPWTEHDTFTVRDLLNGGVLILGRAGSGKTSSSGRTLMTVIANNRQSGGLILAAKPEDATDVARVFKGSGRLNDLIVFGQNTGNRCNFLNCLKRPRDVVTFMMTMSEVLKRGDSKGGENNRFYEAQEERCLYNAVAALQAAGEPITAPNLHQFIMSAARSSAELTTPEWQAKFQSKVLEQGFGTKKGAIESHDFQIALDYWLKEWAGLLDEKTRGNILAGVMGTLHTMNSGLVRQMCCGETNCSPQDVLSGKWVLVDFAPSSFGASGQLISAGWKQLVELAVLERHAGDNSPFVTIWCDEAHQFVTNFDSSYIAQCRSHKGCLAYLTQSVSSFYSAMKGEAGKHQADALLANFTTTIVHACDATTAKWASAKLGRKKEILRSGSSSPAHNAYVWDLMEGRNNSSTSFSEHYEQVLQDQAFMVGRTGGPANRFTVDAVVIRSGEPFANGRNYLKTTFGQK